MKINTSLAFLLVTASGIGQIAVEHPEPSYLKSIQLSGGTEEGELPLLKLRQSLKLSFDDINGDERDYFYKITHHNADWTESNLVRSEFMDGMDDVRILDTQNSAGALQLYTHFTLSIPNEMTTALTKTGNYLLSIYDEDQHLVFSRKFMIYSDIFNVGAEVKRSRDLKYIESKQVLRFFVDGFTPTINAHTNIHVALIQNNNLKTTISGIKPQFTIGNKLLYRYDQETAFWGGNEFFNFDNKDVRAATNEVREIELKELYHHYLYTDTPRCDEPYTLNPDINGNFVITTLQGRTPLTEAEYVWIHFSLAINQLNDGQKVHIYGNFNNYEIDDSTQLKWNKKTRRYQLPYLLKQGFYNYRYVLVNADGTIERKENIDGNYWETENDYQILVYYRKPGGRFDELLGFGQTNSSQITN